jgi:hypothetical protein
MEGGWGPKPDAKAWPLATEPGSDFSSGVSLTKMLKVKANVRYANRWWLRDSGGEDDYLVLEFDPGRADYAALTGHVLRHFVEAMDGYLAEGGDEKLVHLWFEEWRMEKGDYRDAVNRLFPLNYFDAELCRRAFGMTPRQVVAAVEGAVERAEVWRDGALVYVTTEVLPVDQLDARCREADRRLPRDDRWRRPKWSPPKPHERHVTLGEVLSTVGGGAAMRVLGAGMPPAEHGLRLMDYSEESWRMLDKYLTKLKARRRQLADREWGDIRRWRAAYVSESIDRETHRSSGRLSD